MALLRTLPTGTSFWSCNICWDSLAPSGCSTGSGPIPLPLSPGSEGTTAASAAHTFTVPQSFQFLANPWYTATSSTFTSQECGFLPTAHAPSPVGQMFHFSNTCSCRTFVIYPATSAAPQAHSSWALLKDTARPAGNCCSPRANQGRPRAFTNGIYFPYTLN